MLSTEDGQRAVNLARDALARAVARASGTSDPASVPTELPPLFGDARGVFVTLKEFPAGGLRGCIGFALPVLPLERALAEAAAAAGLEDPRFPPVGPEELPRLTVEVSVLSVPERVPGRTPDEIRKVIEIGRDGLIVDGFGRSGLLLPQVAREEGWSAEELLEGTCRKAGLAPDAWRDPRRVRVRWFRAEIFGETRPGGPVERVSG